VASGRRAWLGVGNSRIVRIRLDSVLLRPVLRICLPVVDPTLSMPTAARSTEGVADDARCLRRRKTDEDESACIGFAVLRRWWQLLAAVSIPRREAASRCECARPTAIYTDPTAAWQAAMSC